MATIKSEYYRFNGASWDLHYFKTSADLIVETTSYKVLTADERTRIAAAPQLADTNQRLDFGGSTQYIRLAFSTVSRGYIKHLSGVEQEIWTNGNFNPSNYLPLIGGTLTGSLVGTLATFNTNVSTPQLFVNILNSDGGSIQFSGGLDFVDANNVPIVNVPAPTAGHHAANREFVENLVAEGVRPIPPVKCATVANITLSGLVTIDGYQLVAGDRVLVKNQTTASQNGIYTANAAAWIKVENTVKGLLVFVENGNTYNDWKFYANSTTTWIEFSKVDTVQPGSGLGKTGTSLYISNGGVTNAMLAGSIDWSKLANTGAVDNSHANYDTWAELSAATTTKSLAAHINMILAAIGLLRGTANYNTNNTESIAGAYALANVKNRTYADVAAPVADTGIYKTGDLYFKELSRS